MNTPEVSLSANRLIMLRKDLRRRKERAYAYCDPKLHEEYKANCVVVWNSNERMQALCEKLDLTNQEDFFQVKIK